MKPVIVNQRRGTAHLYYGLDVIDALKLLPEASVQTACTSPPYWGLRDYGTGNAQIGLEETPDEYVAKLVNVFREVARVLRPDGTLWLNLGDSYASDTKWGGSTGGKHVKALHGSSGVRQKRSTGLKQKDLVGIPWRVAFALQADGWYLRSDIIWAKCLSGGTQVYARTQKGERPTTIKDLVRLDPSTVELWNGERWTRVKGWVETPRPENPPELEFRNGERIGCTADHRWPTQRGLLRADEIQIGDVVQTTTLPEPENPRSPALLPDEDIGWFVGLYIAEGSRDATYLHFASHQKEQERFARLQRIADDLDGGFSRYETSENGTDAKVHGTLLHALIDHYVSGKTAKTKHLHPRCWGRSNAFLRGVLGGYLSGDGHYDEGNDRWRLGFTKNDSLASDLRVLGARLGISVRLKRTQHMFDGRKFPGWRGQLRFTVSDHHNTKYDGEIVAIHRSRARKFWDLEVEDDPHLFALGSGLLTHNSSVMPESVRDRPTKAHEYVFLFAHPDSGGRYFYDADAIREPSVNIHRSKDTPGTRSNQPASTVRGSRDSSGGVGYHEGGRNKRSWWNINPKPYKGAHFAVWPPDLVRPMILAGSSEHGACSTCGAPWKRVVDRVPVVVDAVDSGNRKKLHGPTYSRHKQSIPGGQTLVSTRVVGESWEPSCECPEHEPVRSVVLDPFSGSATTGMVALQEGRDYIGIDLNAGYIPLAKARVLGQKAPRNKEEDQEPNLILELFGAPSDT